MSNFIRINNYIFAILLTFICLIYILFTYHSFLVGTDEIRTTLVACEIVKKGNIFYKDVNNDIFKTNIFVKNGFKINSQKVIYPFGFILNTLINVPFIALSGCDPLIMNLIPMTVFVASILAIYKIFILTGIDQSKSILGSIIFAISNFFLALFVSFYPDNILIFIFLTVIWVILKYRIDFNSLRVKLLLSIFISFLLAYKITVFPLAATVLPFYLYLDIKKHHKIRYAHLFQLLIIFLSISIIYLYPQLYSTKVGPSYNQENIQNGQVNNDISKKSVIKVFLDDYLIPKENGQVLSNHVIRDLIFFLNNNLYILIGFIFTLSLFRKDKFSSYFLLSIFITSFWFWGNMNVYGGSDTFHLRNSHIRYMLPIFIIFYLYGFRQSIKRINMNFHLLFLTLILMTSFSSLRNDYPFSIYSTVNRQGYYFDAIAESNKVKALNIPQNAIVLSALYDDFDFSYFFPNYADLKITQMQNGSLLNTVDSISHNSTNKSKYILIPNKDSRYNPITSDTLEELKNYILSTENSSLIYESDYQYIYKI